MAIRATGEQVRLLTGSTLLDAALAPFIGAANVLVEAAILSGCAAALTDATLTSAENFLAAHLLTQSGVGSSVGVKIEERFENYAVKYSGGVKSGDGILSSGYGQTANMLMNGCLSNAIKSASVEFF